MPIKLFILISMIAFHVLFDWVLQPEHMRVKKKLSFWERTDLDHSDQCRCVTTALLVHGFFWAFGINIPIIAYVLIAKVGDVDLLLTVAISWIVINACWHAFIDHLNINIGSINLPVDQIIHIIQVIFLWWSLITFF